MYLVEMWGRLWWAPMFILFICCFAEAVTTDPTDVKVMQKLRNSLVDAESLLGWKGLDPCTWESVACSGCRVVGIQMQNKGVKGTLPSDFNNLSALTNIGFQNNQLSGALPTFKGMEALQYAFLNRNNFTSIPHDFFSGLTNLQVIAVDHNPFTPWSIPDTVKDAANLVNFTANNASVVGSIPGFFGDWHITLQMLGLAYNNLTGSIPETFSTSHIVTIWLNNRVGEKLSGSIDVVAKMTSLLQLWLQSNAFTGPIPDLSKLQFLRELRVRDNRLTGLVPSNLSTLRSLHNISLRNNALQGPYPSFGPTVTADIGDASANSFCLPAPGKCDARVNTLLEFAKGVGYPHFVAPNWTGNNPCDGWLYVTCDPSGNVTVLSMAALGLRGTISPALAGFGSLKALVLGNNSISGPIPSQLAELPNLEKLDVSNNNLNGTLPIFKPNVVVIVDGNPQLRTNASSVRGQAQAQAQAQAHARAHGSSSLLSPYSGKTASSA